jgi:hypothetical protein
VFSENGVAFLYTKFADDHRFETFFCVYFETMLTPLRAYSDAEGLF